MGNLMQSKTQKQMIKTIDSLSKIKITLKMPNSTVSLQISQSDTIKKLKYKIQDMQNIVWSEQKLTYKNKQLKDDKKMADYNIKDGDIIELTIVKLSKQENQKFNEKSQFHKFNDIKTDKQKKEKQQEDRMKAWMEMRKNLKPGMQDIGVFQQNHSIQSSQILEGQLSSINDQKTIVDQLIAKFNANPSANHSVYKLSISDITLKKIIDYADRKYQQAIKNNMNRREIEDLKITLNRDSLINLIGQDLCQQLEKIFGFHNEIIIRRCQAHGRLIDFHTDISKRTLQLALNDDTEYVGGRLMFATEGKFIIPSRPKGTITVHDNTIVHGVTRLQSGIRYGLFLLDK